MKPMNFYTANGWAGSNYSNELSTKEIAAKVRSYAKKNFPGFKFSVRYEWSMYTDSLYIVLKSGTCVPFVEGSRSAERGYMRTMSTVKGWEKDLTPEMFAVLDSVATYASSFRYDDSDGMQDYYDTNFYLRIEVSDEYQVVEPKGKRNTTKAEKETAVILPEPVEGVEVVDYSEKAVAVFGDTKAIKEQLKELGGRFNPSLKYNGERRAGWIFSKKQAEEVRKLVEPSELPAPPEAVYVPELQPSQGGSMEESGKQQTGLSAYPLENIYFTETGNFNGVYYYDIEGAGIITSAKVRAGIQTGDVFNVYTDNEREYGITYDGVSLNRSLYNSLPGIVQQENNALSVEVYEKKVNGKRYTVKDKPLTLGYYGVLDNLDNSIIDCYPTKEEAEKEAETLNGFTDENGRLKKAV